MDESIRNFKGMRFPIGGILVRIRWHVAYPMAHRRVAAVKEFNELIGDSVARVEAGGRMVNAVGKTLSEVVASVYRGDRHHE